MRRPKVSASKAARLTRYAGTMRGAPTTSEALVWQVLRGSQLGVGFRRQFVIGSCIVDFAAPSARLVVEVDGGYHAERAKADARRDRQLEQLGWRVVRLPAEFVARDFEQAIAIIKVALINE